MITLAKPIERKGCRLPQRQRSLTAGVHRHSFGSQHSHVRAAHDRGAEIDPVARSETWVIEQRLDVAEVWVVLRSRCVRLVSPLSALTSLIEFGLRDLQSNLTSRIPQEPPRGSESR